MKLAEGMYVRTKRRTLQPPQIARIRNMSKDSLYKNHFYIELDKNLIPSYEYHIYIDDIENAKHSLIELVKAGDYVNGKLVAYIEDIYTSDNIFIGKYLYEEDKSLIGGEEDIKTIVTKEQFEAMQYKVVE